MKPIKVIRILCITGNIVYLLNVIIAIYQKNYHAMSGWIFALVLLLFITLCLYVKPMKKKKEVKNDNSNKSRN